MIEIGKAPPQAVDIEESILGCLINTPDSIINTAELLSVDTFYKQENKYIFEIIQDLIKGKKSIDVMVVANECKNKGVLDIVSLQHISSIISKACNQYKIEDYTKIIKSKEIARKQIDLGNELVKKGYNDTTDPLETNDFLTDETYKLSSLSDVSVDSTNEDILEDVLKQIQRANETKGMTGINTGYNVLNSITGGLQPTELIILAARPAMGKTALALCLLLNASYSDKRGLMFSLEMGKDQLMKRLLSIDAQIDGHKLKSGDLEENEWNQIHDSVGRLNTDNIKIIDDVYTLNGIVNKSKRERLKGKVDFIIVDYLQLVGNRQKSGNREQEISSISRGLKMLAKDLNVPVICLSQLSRAVETRGGDKRPMLSDLRESGAIEQDADIVMFLYRAEYYGLTEMEDGSSTAGMADLIISKNRSGSLANIELKFNHSCTKFTDDNNGFSAMQRSKDFE